MSSRRAGFLPRMSALMVWRRALLVIACILSSILAVKSCFDPHSFRAQYEESTLQVRLKAAPGATSEQVKEITKAVAEETDNVIKTFGESNVSVINALSFGLWLTIFASLAFQILAAREWRDWKRSRKLAIIAVAVVLIPQMLAMLLPWTAMMDFKHLEQQGAGSGGSGQMKMTVQIALLGSVLMSALPFFYGLFNGILKASLTQNPGAGVHRLRLGHHAAGHYDLCAMVHCPEHRGSNPGGCADCHGGHLSSGGPAQYCAHRAPSWHPAHPGGSLRPCEKGKVKAHRAQCRRGLPRAGLLR